LLKENLEATQITLHQLIGGLYNQRTQKKMLNKHTVCLFSLNQDVSDDEDLEENKWPTTRQGDENEERIKKLEENIDVLVKRLKKGRPLHRFYRKFQKK
jgi:cob(I)alamin adenosyltransferase